jgi:hypothetical protein
MEAKRKGQGSISRKTAKRVKQSPESLNIRLALGANASMTLDLTCPPQLKDERVIRLCVLHSLAFFFLITYDPHSAQGKVWPGKFLPVHWVFKGDWGNPVHTAFANAVVSWSTRVLGIAANGFFRVVMRKHPAKLCWSWAYEWNQNVRIIGFFGETEVAQQIAATFPSLGGFLWENGNQFTRIREEIALADSEEDNLFVVTN